MSSLGIPRIDRQYGAARVTSGGAFVANIGVIESVLRTGPGVYEYTLAPGANMNECVLMIQPIGSSSTTKITATVDWISNTLIRVRTTGTT